MAKPTREVIIDFSILDHDAVKTIEELNRKIENLKTWQARLREEGLKNSETYIKNEQAIKDYTNVLKANQKVLQDEIKLQREEDGSLNQMRVQLNSLIKEFSDLSRAEREAGEGAELLKKIDAQREAVQELEHAIGDHRRQVGKYDEALSKLGTAGGKVSMLFTQLSKGTISVGRAFRAGTGVIKAFGKELLTLLANPVVAAIALIAAAVLKLVQAFKKNEEAVQKVNDAMKSFEPILAIVDKLVGALADVIAKVVSAVGDLTTAFAGIVFPDWVGEAEKAHEYKDTVESIRPMEGEKNETTTVFNIRRENAIDNGDKDELKAAYKDYQEMVDKEVKAAFLEWQGLYNYTRDLRKKDVDDLSKKEKEKLDKVKEANAKYQAKMKESADIQKALNSDLEKIDKKREDEENKRREKEEKAREKAARETQKANEKRRREEEKEARDREAREKLLQQFYDDMSYTVIDKEADAYERQRIRINETYEKRLKDAKEKYKELGLTEEDWIEYQAALNEQMEIEIAEVTRQEMDDIQKLVEQIDKINLNPVEITDEEQLENLKRMRDGLEALYDEALTAVDENGNVEQYNKLLEVKQRLFEVNEKIAKQEEKMAQDEERHAQDRVDNTTRVLSSMKDVVSGLGGVFEALAEDNEKFAQYSKALAITEAVIAGTIASVQAIATATRSSATWIDMLVAIGTVVSVVAGIVATAVTQLNSQKIKSAPRFSGGGLVGDHETTRTDDTVDAKLSLGEYVIRSKRVKELGVDYLDSLNYGTDRPSMRYTNLRSYAEGGYVRDDNYGQMKMAFSEALEEMPAPIVDVREVTDKQNRVKVKENL